MNSFLDDYGFIIVEDIFSVDEITTLKEETISYFARGNGFSNEGGFAKPDWIADPKTKKIKEIVDKKNINKIISQLIGEEVRFVGHNDLHLNRSVGWHKDRLNNEARRFELHHPWQIVDDQTMKIYKANIYLQDHSENNDGLIVIPGSHKTEELMPRGSKQIILRPKLGDLVVFDQRVTHASQYSRGYDRGLICVGYGVENIFFEEFKKGTEFRQNKQNLVRI